MRARLISAAREWITAVVLWILLYAFVVLVMQE
jgi:hypothetical protein